MSGSPTVFITNATVNGVKVRYVTSGVRVSVIASINHEFRQMKREIKFESPKWKAEC